MDRSTSWGIASGGLTVLAGLIGYYLVPLLTGDYSGQFIFFIGLSKFSDSPLDYHAFVLMTPSFLGTLAGILDARRWRSNSRRSSLKIVGATIAIPVVSASALAIFGSVGYALNAFLNYPAPSSGLLDAVLSLFSLVAFAALTVLFGQLFLIGVVLPILVSAVSGGAILGYLVVRGLVLVGRWRKSRRR